MRDNEFGRVAVGLARKSIEAYLVGENVINRSAESGPLSEERGVFVTLYTHPSGELRGCIGFPYPVMPLSEALVKAAIAAATQDPRFEPMTIEELDNVVLEVSILSRPEEIKYGNRRELPRLVRVGVDGLIIETPYGSGLLLPQVPVEYGWDAETYLTHLCLKAGVNPTYWLYGSMKLLRYTAQIFRESEPGGRVVEVKLGV